MKCLDDRYLPVCWLRLSSHSVIEGQEKCVCVFITTRLSYHAVPKKHIPTLLKDVIYDG